MMTTARFLADPPAASDAQLRRAVSTAYYALFHKVAGAAAERFIGPGTQSTAAFRLIYRGFEHRRVKQACEALQAKTLKEVLKRALGRNTVSEDMRSFAETLPALQEGRHSADYDPTAQFLRSDVQSLIAAAESAIDAFDRVASAEIDDVLALMLVGARD